jgi:hypothetical protein
MLIKEFNLPASCFCLRSMCVTGNGSVLSGIFEFDSFVDQNRIDLKIQNNKNNNGCAHI